VKKRVLVQTLLRSTLADHLFVFINQIPPDCSPVPLFTCLASASTGDDLDGHGADSASESVDETSLEEGEHADNAEKLTILLALIVVVEGICLLLPSQKSWSACS